ncbi:MAG: arsenite methyltransferase [Actinomycetota bacterium]|nr:arsenite methyltransferase [Actinomycetota bacterium]
MTATDELREHVRDRYAAAAAAVGSGSGQSCCGPTDALALISDGDESDVFGAGLYAAGQTDGLPAEAVLTSLGCGNPLAVADLRTGERVLDLGSGGGIDVLLSAKRVGPTGFAYGLDMTDEMLDLARANASRAGAENVEFLKGQIEQIPLPDASIDVIISNCVINLSTDKPAVLAEMFRVLAPAGRIGISDVVAEDHLTPAQRAQRAQRGSYVGCIAGALSVTEYLDGLASAGFADPEVVFTHQVADGLHGAIVRATKSAAAGCCTPADQASCCEPSAKPDCCGTPTTGDIAAASCGCQ